MSVAEAGVELRAFANSFSKELTAIGDDIAARRQLPTTWSPKQVLGHLIDSAANNHQRFVRAQQADAVMLPGYDQNQWVESQGYQDADWGHLIALWTHLNLHLADVIAHMRPEKYSVPCVIGDSHPLTLEQLVVDYLTHLKHHAAQLRWRLT
jgi:hypothetical protein